MNKKFAWCIGGLFLLAQSIPASAYTIDEIVEACPFVMSEVKNFQSRWYTVNINADVFRGYGLRFEKVDESHLKICGIEGRYDFIFTLTNTSGATVTDGTQLRITGNEANTNQEETDNVAYYLYPIVSTNIYQSAYNWNRNETFKLQITKDSQGNFAFGQVSSDTKNGRGYYLYEWLATTAFDCSGCVAEWVMAPMEHYLYLNPDFQAGIATDRFDDYKYKSGAAASADAPRNARRYLSKERTYPVLVKMDQASHTLEFINLMNRGYGYDPSAQQTVKGSFKDDGTFTLDLNYQHYKRYDGGRPYYIGWDGYQITNIDPATNTVGSRKVTGTYEYVDARHTRPGHQWVTDGGELRTYAGVELQFEDFCLKTTASHSSFLNIDGAFFDTSILFGEDVTADLDLHIDVMGDNPGDGLDFIQVEGAITTNRNAQMVDHYELCVVPGYYTSIHQEGFVHSLTEGHVSATNIHSHGIHTPLPDSGLTTRESTSNADSKDYTFFKRVPYSALNAKSDNKEYTFFVKTIYTPESGLEPTFHNLTPYNEDTMTSLNSINADSDINEVPEYYTTTGIRTEHPQKGNIYIVRRGSSVSKIRF